MSPAEPLPSAQEIRAAFDAVNDLTIGLEEEVMLLDAETFDLAPHGSRVLARLEGDRRFKAELPEAQLETITPPLEGVAQAAEALRDRRATLAAACGDEFVLGCAGVHPFAALEGEISPAQRYAGVVKEYGVLARRQLAFALQVHVAIRGADRAFAVYEGLRRHLPEIAALAANAPFQAGADSGLASVRPTICTMLPRQGIPPPLAGAEDFAAAMRWSATAGSMPSSRQWWWELRPHARHGTLEVRVPDAQTTVADAAAVAAVVQCLAAHELDRHDAGEATPAPAAGWRLAENRWSACRHGVQGSMGRLDADEQLPTRDRLNEILDASEAHAVGLDCEAGLTHARSLIAANGAMRQREVAADRGVSGLVAWLAEQFAA